MLTYEFCLAGDAIFTVQEPNGVHHTYRISKVEANDRWPESYFVKFLSGPDNTSDYTYLGKLDKFLAQVNTTAKSTSLKDCWKLKVLNRVLARLAGNDYQAIEKAGWKVHHEGRCGRCGRTLTVPSSIESGVGPECAKILAGV